jgi:gamma-glutamyl phosphate reductase
MAKRVVLDAKVDYPAACNAMVCVFIYIFYSLLVSISTLFLTFSMIILLSLDKHLHIYFACS